ncbi:MAG: WYL domain-containing protein [Phycisphaerae bacterium]
MRTKRIERLLRLIQALQSHRSETIDDLAELAGVSRRTVFRDLELLSRGGIRYAYDRETRCYSADRFTLLPPVTLTHAEALALMLATRYMLNQRFMPDESAATSAGLKLESMLPPILRGYCGSTLTQMEIRGDPASDTGSILDSISMLQKALATQKRVRVAYDSYYDEKTIEVVLHPYRLAYIHRGWYLIAVPRQGSFPPKGGWQRGRNQLA